MTWESLDALRRIPEIGKALGRADQLDIVVTSAGAHWDQGCGGFLNLCASVAQPEDLRALREASCIGDLLWQPIGPSGPIELGTGVCAVTVLGLNRLQEFVSAGKRVILMLAPCQSCRGPKPEVLAAVLRWERAITDLVVDSRTAVEFLRSRAPVGAP